jgi:CYTH domain-containing protein
MSRMDYHLQITDNYITGTRLRIRRVRDPNTNKWIVKFTQKFAPDPNDLSRTIITNTYLNAIEAETLSVFEANEIRKNRYPFPFEGREFSIDMFLGDLHNFPMPPFAIVEVTNNEIFSGGKLSELTFADIRKEVEQNGLV